MPGDAKVIVGASEVAGGRRHLYLLFEHADGSRIVVRGGPDTRTEGNDLQNFAESTLLGSDKFGHIRVDAEPYVPPYTVAIRVGRNQELQVVPLDQVEPQDRSLLRDANGQLVVQQQVAPDWQWPGQFHERVVAWRGTDEQLDVKLRAALDAGRQINQAQLEYSPLGNNSNGVVSALMTAAIVPHVLPRDREGHAVNAPNFGEPLYQDVGAGTYRSGYSFDGRVWRDDEDRQIKPPRHGQAVEPTGPVDQTPSRSGSLDLSAVQRGGESNPARLPVMLSNDDARLLDRIVGQFQPVDAAHGKCWDEASDRICASLLKMAKQKGFNASDDLRVAFNQPTERHAAGALVHLYRVGPDASPDPFANRAHMTTADALSMPVEARYRQAQEIGLAQAEAMQLATQQAQMPRNDAGQGGPRMVV